MQNLCSTLELLDQNLCFNKNSRGFGSPKLKDKSIEILESPKFILLFQQTTIVLPSLPALTLNPWKRSFWQDCHHYLQLVPPLPFLPPYQLMSQEHFGLFLLSLDVLVQLQAGASETSPESFA